MQKQITLSLLIMSTTFGHAMEHEAISFLSSFPFTSFFSTWFSSSQTANESKLISDIRASKNEFEKQLKSRWVKILKTNIPSIQIFSAMDIFRFQYKNSHSAALWFLYYCYYQQFHKDEMWMNLDQLKNLNLFDICQKAQIDGHSAFSATIIAEDISIEQKRNFIQKLINNGFKPTQKDIGIAKLNLYDETKEHQITTLHLLHAHSLPQEIRKQITQHLLQLYKNEFWLLPETTLNDL